MKKIGFLVLAGILLVGMTFAFTSCEKESAGKLICGVTEYEPMNYRDANGNWLGFDTEFALLVGEKLGMEVEFQLIEWSNKFAELNSRAISAIWNGFTATANEPDGTPRISLCDMSYSYMLNTQSIVIRADRSGEFNALEDLIGMTVAAEAGSAGETKARGLVGDEGTVIGTPAQIHTFMEVMSGAVDAAIIDIILAQQLAGTGDYASLMVSDIELDAEVYAIGFRQGDPLRDRVNTAMAELYEEGTLAEIARKYGLEERLVLDRTFGR